jgi:hypothetical protein
MPVRVIRFLEYEYPDHEAAELDMAMWGVPANCTTRTFGWKSTAIRSATTFPAMTDQHLAVDNVEEKQGSAPQWELVEAFDEHSHQPCWDLVAPGMAPWRFLTRQSAEDALANTQHLADDDASEEEQR